MCIFDWHNVLLEKDLLEKAAAMKKFEYSLLGKELKKQSSVAEKQNQIFDNDYEFDIIKKEEPAIKKYNRSNLIYHTKFKFYGYCNIP